MNTHHTPHLFSRPDQIAHKLFVVCTVFNPIRFRTRWKLYQDFVRMCDAQGDTVELYTVEVAFGERAFSVTEPDNPRHIQLRTRSELWLKEAALNVGFSRLPAHAKYIAWIDADVSFVRGDWANETLHQLQHYDIVQMWSEAYDLGPEHQILQSHKSFAYCYTHGIPWKGNATDYYGQKDKKSWYHHPGFAWAAKRKTLDMLGGLMDFCILGSADHHMAHALIGEVDRTLLRHLTKRYKQLLKQWEHHAKHLQANLGYVPGSLLHYYHGAKAQRRYQDRWQILTECGFDPDIDLKRDIYGLWQLTGRSPKLRDALRAYNRQRNEDSTYVDDAWSTTMIQK